MANHPRIQMDQLIDRVEKLHTAPQVACQVLILLQDEDFEIQELVTCLESDPALASTILRLVNSSYFGVARNIASLQHAVTYLGSRSLRLAVLSFGLLKHLNQDTPRQVYYDFWRRSLTMAVAGSAISNRVYGVRSDEAYSTGLLSDVGVLIFAQVETERYVENYEQLKHTPELVAWETETFGFDHGQLGARLLARWNLPDHLTGAVAHHHTRSPNKHNWLFRLAYAADLLADCLWTPKTPRMGEARRVLDVDFGLDLDGFISLAIGCKERIAENAEMYRVELTGSIDCDAILEQARQQYMEEAMEAAMDWDSLTAISEHRVV